MRWKDGSEFNGDWVNDFWWYGTLKLGDIDDAIYTGCFN